MMPLGPGCQRPEAACTVTPAGNPGASKLKGAAAGALPTGRAAEVRASNWTGSLRSLAHSQGNWASVRVSDRVLQ
jgi:hypothetical protein